MQGDESAFVVFFHHYRNRIYGLALRMTRSTCMAEEIVQEVFLKIWMKKADLMDMQNLKAYLFTLARNDIYKVLKQISKNYQKFLLAEQERLPVDNNSEGYEVEEEYTTLLRKAIDRLADQQKQVYNLKERGLSREKAAVFLHLYPETVKSHLVQALRTIRNFCVLHL